MAYQPVDIGSAPNDGTGDPIRDAFDKVNDNFVEVYAATTGLLDFKGSTDCSANPNYPAASKGDFYLVSVAGKIGGASGTDVTAGDTYFALADNAGGTQAAVGTSWTVIQGNVAYVPVNKAGDTMSGDLIVPDEVYDATNWNGNLEVPTKNAVRDKIETLAAGTPTELDDLTDVNAPTPSNNDVLTWDSTPGEWVAAAPGAGSFVLDDATDVNAPTPSNNDVLTWDSTPGEWVAAAPTGGGIASGTSFPGSPSSGDLFYRSDRRIQYFYDGTRWLSIEQFSVQTIDFGTAQTASFDMTFNHPWINKGYGIYVETFQAMIRLTNATTASNYFVAQLNSFENTGAVTTPYGSGLSSAGSTTNAFTQYSEAINAVIASTEDIILIRTTETGAATGRVAASFTYRLVG